MCSASATFAICYLWKNRGFHFHAVSYRLIYCIYFCWNLTNGTGCLCLLLKLISKFSCHVFSSMTFVFLVSYWCSWAIVLDSFIGVWMAMLVLSHEGGLWINKGLHLFIRYLGHYKQYLIFFPMRHGHQLISKTCLFINISLECL